MRIKNSLFVVVLILTTIVNLQGQNSISFLKKKGNKFFRNEHYRKALPLYEKILTEDPQNADAMFKAGVCYLYRFSKEKALDCILRAYELDPRVNKYYHFWLGRAYHSNYEFDKALEAYTAYQNSLRKTDLRNKDIEKYITQVRNAREFTRNPQNYLVKNLGPVINTSASEHSPVTTKNDSILYFTSRKESIEGKEDFDGEFFEDIYKSLKKSDGSWSKPELIDLNTSGHDASIQLFDNDSKMLLYRQTKGGDIYYTERLGTKWSEPIKFANVNSKDFEADAFVTEDGKTAWFATNRFKQKGDLDIYVVHKQEDGSWSRPEELGGVINSNDDEDAPFVTPDGKTLYFSSRGHKNMGGFDVFKSTLDNNGNWTTPVNLGYPVNTPDDDVYFYFSSKNKSYMASYREGGYGEKDIYEVLPISKVAIKGKVIEEKSGLEIKNVEVYFQSLRKTTTANKDSSRIDKGEFSVKLFSYNTYKVEVAKDGKVIHSEEFEIPHESESDMVISKDIFVPYYGRTEVKKLSPFNFKYIFRDLMPANDKLSTLNVRELNIVGEVLKNNPDMKLEIAVSDEGEDIAGEIVSTLLGMGINKANISVVNSSHSGKIIKLLPSDVEAVDLNFNSYLIPAEQIGEDFILRNVYFESANSILSKEAKYELNLLSEILKENKEVKVSVQGHTDNSGSDNINKNLSQNRAKAVHDYLLNLGIEKERIHYIGYGKGNPVADNNTIEGRLLNRRVEIRILK